MSIAPRYLVAAAAIAIALPTLAAAQVVKLDVPVMIGGIAEIDACNGYGEIAELKPPDDFLSVRSGPAARYREIDRLKAGNKVFVCNDRAGWVAVVYPAEDRDCGVSTPWPKRRAYNGPCKRGWIFGKYLKMLAG